MRTLRRLLHRFIPLTPESFEEQFVGLQGRLSDLKDEVDRAKEGIGDRMEVLAERYANLDGLSIDIGEYVRR